MKVSLIGGTGFVGSHIVTALIEAGHTPRLMIRDRHQGPLAELEECEIVRGAVQDPGAVAECVEGADAVVYLIGILREFPSKGVTFEELQHHGASRTIAASNASS